MIVPPGHQNVMKQDSQMNQRLDPTARTQNEAREKLKLYSSQLSQQAKRMLEMQTEMSELEGQLTCHAQAMEKLRAQSSGVPVGKSTTGARADTSIVADGNLFDPNGGARLMALPTQVPVSRTVGFTEISWDTGDGLEGQVYISVDGQPEALFASGSRGAVETN